MTEAENDALQSPCPFCGGGLTETRLIPQGWRISFHKIPGLSISQLGGVSCTTDRGCNAFLEAWGRRV